MPIARKGILENIALGTDGQYAGSTGTTALYKTIEADEIATSDGDTVATKLSEIYAYIPTGVLDYGSISDAPITSVDWGTL